MSFEVSEAKNKLLKCKKLSMVLGGRFDFDALSESIGINEAKMAEPNFWDDQESAQKLIDQTNQLKQSGTTLFLKKPTG